MITYYEHSFEESLLEKGNFILDLGCGVDFLFANKMAETGMNVICVDPNPKIKFVQRENVFYERKAIDCSSGLKELKVYKDTDAATIIDVKNDILNSIGKQTIETITIEEIMDKYNVDMFDVVKMDIEGSEYNFLMNMKRKFAKQISVEFHDFRGMNPFHPNNDRYYDELMKKIGCWYNIIPDICAKPGWMGKKDSKWDVLFIQKGEL